MDRVNAADYVTISGRRTFADPNLGLNQQGTDLAALWHAGVQESIIGVIEGAGQTPADVSIGAADTQLFQAIRASGASAITVVTVSAGLTLLGAGLILVSAAAGNVVLTLPPSNTGAAFSTEYKIFRTDMSANNVTLVLSGGNTWITGGSAAVPVAYASPLTVVNDGFSKWMMLGRPTHGTLLALLASQSIPDSLETAVLWPPTPLYDDVGAWNLVFPDRFTIPAGVTRIRVDAQLTFTANAVGSRKMRVLRNLIIEGSGLPATRNGTPDVTDVTILNGTSGIYPVTPGDFLQLMAFQSSGAPLNLAPAGDNWFALECL